MISRAYKTGTLIPKVKNKAPRIDSVMSSPVPKENEWQESPGQNVSHGRDGIVVEDFWMVGGGGENTL
jgi:hypothetical protein